MGCLLGALLIGGLVFACSPRTVSWKERVLLTDTETAVVERKVWYRMQGAGIGSNRAPVATRHKLTIHRYESGSHEVTDVIARETTLEPVYLGLDATDGSLVILETIRSCQQYWKLGRPNPPYQAVRWGGAGWIKESIPQSFLGKPTNLLSDWVTSERGTLSADDVAFVNRGSASDYTRVVVVRSKDIEDCR